jgi:short-subunit dehydrogenase
MIIGATSAIAEATARFFAENGDALYLVARNQEKLTAIAGDLKVRGASSVHTEVLDVLEYDRHQAVIDDAISVLQGLDLVLIAHGTLPDQIACEQSFDLTRKEFEVNSLTTISLLTHLAIYFEMQQRGTIAVISSVAGDRGRQSNYVYGAAKGTISIFLQGLRNRLHKSGVHVITIKPGFVDTPMTTNFKKGVLWVSPQTIAHIITNAIAKSETVTYAPFFWRPIMWLIKILPEYFFKRLSL